MINIHTLLNLYTIYFRVIINDSSAELEGTNRDCAHWRHRENHTNVITYSKWASNEGCEGDTCARMQGNGMRYH